MQEDKGDIENAQEQLRLWWKIILYINISNALIFGIYGLYFSLIFHQISAFPSISLAILNLSAFTIPLFRKEVKLLIATGILNLFGYAYLSILYGHSSGSYIMLIIWIISTSYLYKTQKSGLFLLGLGLIVFIATDHIMWQQPPIIHTDQIDFLHYTVIVYGIGFLAITIRTIRATNQKINDSLIKKSQTLNKYFTAIEQSSASILITDPNGIIEYVNPQFEQTSGYRSSQSIGHNINMLKSDKTPNELYKDLWETITKGETWNGTFYNKKRNGEEYIERATIAPVKDKDGATISYITEKEDITDKARIQQKLEENEKKYRFITEQTRDLIWIIDLPSLTYTYVSPSIKIMRGYEPEELIGKSIKHSLSESSYKNIKEDIKDAIESINKNNENVTFLNRYTQVSKDGKEDIIELSGTFIVPKDGKPTQLLGTSRIITEKVKMENEILQKNEELKQILSTTEEQKKIIETINEELMDSINYAKSIQEALLTSPEVISDCFREHFLIYYPKTTVGGDFYYFRKMHGKIIFAIADCTGHGVPGGFMTILGINYLHAIIKRNDYSSPAHVLEILRMKMKSTFKTQDGYKKDGFDISLCIYDIKTDTLTFSGAYNPLWIVSNGEMTEYPAVKSPIGFHYDEKDFINIEIPIKHGDEIYMFSDGFYDQFGGVKDKRYTKKRLRNNLLEVHGIPMTNQKDILKASLFNWMSAADQTDDITLLGIKWQQ